MQYAGLHLIAQHSAAAHELPLPLVLGIIEVESAGDEYATRAEPGYRWCWDCRAGRPYTATPAQCRQFAAPDDFHAPHPDKAGYYESDDTEWVHQRTSWGLMQVIGAVAREHGLRERLTTLCEAHVGIDFGCRHLARLRDRFIARHGWAGVLDAYNDGTPRIERHPDYPDRIAATSEAAAKLIHPPT
jgi:glycine/D-amino acid oxidase-like deaminating enzyme